MRGKTKNFMPNEVLFKHYAYLCSQLEMGGRLHSLLDVWHCRMKPLGNERKTCLEKQMDTIK